VLIQTSWYNGTEPSSSVWVPWSTCQTMGLFVRHSICLLVNLSVSQSVCQSICLSVNLSVCQSVCLSICLSVNLSVCQSDCQSVCQSICLSVNLSARLSACQYVLLFSLKAFLLNRNNKVSMKRCYSNPVSCEHMDG